MRRESLARIAPVAWQAHVEQLLFRVAGDTNNRHVVEIPKDFSHPTLGLKLGLAHCAPSLQVIWIAAVLDKSKGRTIRPKHVATDYGRGTRAMRPAFNSQWMIVSHWRCGFTFEVSGPWWPGGGAQLDLWVKHRLSL